MATFLADTRMRQPALAAMPLTSAEQASLQRAPRLTGAVEGLGSYVGQAGIRADQVRRPYVDKTSRLDRNASAERTALKKAMRAATPAPLRTWLNYRYRDLGPGPDSVGGAARTSAAATTRAAQIGRLGRASLVGSALLGGAEILTSDDRPRAASAVAGGMGGGVAGGILGAESGAVIGSLFPGAGTVAGAVIGGLAGSLGGGAIGHDAGGKIHDRFRRR